LRERAVELVGKEARRGVLTDLRRLATISFYP
jgi:hypothetical protein